MPASLSEYTEMHVKESTQIPRALKTGISINGLWRWSGRPTLFRGLMQETASATSTIGKSWREGWEKIKLNELKKNMVEILAANEACKVLFWPTPG